VTNPPARPTKSSTVPPRPGAYRRPALAGTSKPTRRRRLFWLTIIVSTLGSVAVGLAFGLGGSATEAFAGPPGPEGIPLEVGAPIAPETSAASGQTVRGVQCDAGEEVVYHIHTHLAIYVNGVLRPVPPGIGIVSPVAQATAEGPFYEATQCYYWLHVHAQDGVIHIESPTVRAYSLGDFFAIWVQPLSSAQVGPVTGRLSVFVDGRRYYANPANIPLRSHEDIQIDVGTPIVPPKTIDWAATNL